MKVTNKLSWLLAICILSFACSEEGENEDVLVKNYLKVSETEYDLSSAVILNYGAGYVEYPGHEGYHLGLIIASGGISLKDSNGNGMPDYDGEGQMIHFELFSSDESGLPEGEYNFSVDFTTNTYKESDVYLDYSDGDSGENTINVTSGKVVVKRSGADYEISIECMGQNSEPIVGYYKGAATYFDYTEDDSSARRK